MCHEAYISNEGSSRFNPGRYRSHFGFRYPEKVECPGRDLRVCDLIQEAPLSKGMKSAADAARLFNVHPTTVSRLLARAHSEMGSAKP